MIKKLLQEQKSATQQGADERAIQVTNLTKSFKGGLVAVDGINFSVSEGEIFGLLGPNGAGKTTTIRTIITLTKPTQGSVSVFGIDALRKPHEVRQMIGYVPQLVSVDSSLTAYENLLIFSKLFLVERSVRRNRIEEALAYMGLTERASDLVLHFSGGMMRRLEIAQALVNRPRILFLDEPSIGLDPTSKRQGWDYIKRLRREFGITVFITTHDMNEADELCDRIAIMNRGKIAITGSPRDLKSSIRGDVVSLSFSSGVREEIFLPENLGIVLGSGEEGNSINIKTREEAESALPRLIEFFTSSGFSINSVSVSKPNLDDVFAKYTRGNLTGDEDAGMFKEARLTRKSFARHSG